jgi:transposase-like protein
MPWHCPVCRATITHAEADDRPRPDAVYRCYACRRELQWNDKTSQLELLPLRLVQSERDIP